MIRIYGFVCDKYINFKISDIFKNTLGVSAVCSKCDNEYKKIFKEEWSIEILKFIGFITNIEEYQKIYNQDWRKRKLQI